MSDTADDRVEAREPVAATVSPLWWAVLGIAPLLVGAAVSIDPAAGGDDLARAQLEILRMGLPLMALGVVGVWVSRRIFTADFRAVATRFTAAPLRIEPDALVPTSGPKGLTGGLWVGLVCWALAVGVGLFRGLAWVERVTWENGLLETATVLAYLAGMVFALIGWRRSLRRPRSLRALALLGLGAACFLIAAEETDWGQTYLRYATPDAFEDANIQQDFSLHNLAPPSAVPGTRWANWALKILAALGGGVLPLLLIGVAFFRRVAWALEAPLPPWWSQAVFLLAALVPEIEGLYERANVGSELREFSIAMAVVVWLGASAYSAPRMAPRD